jgi:transcription antitermination factor NusG
MEHVAKMAVACPLSNFSSFQPQNPECNLHALPWFALQIRQRGRELGEQMLASADYEYFSPCTVSERQWSDRRKLFNIPLFPGYIFCRFDPQRRLPILKMPGVIGIVSAGRQLLEVDASELAAIRMAIASKLPIEPVPYLVPGERVCIISGPLRGVEGVLEQIKKRPRLLLSVTMLNRSISVEIHSSQVESITKAI